MLGSGSYIGREKEKTRCKQKCILSVIASGLHVYVRMSTSNVLQMLTALPTQVSLISEIDTTIFRPTVWTNDVQEGFGLDIARVSSSPALYIFIPIPHSYTSFLYLIPIPHLHTSFLYPIPIPHSQTSFPYLIPTSHSPSPFPRS